MITTLRNLLATAMLRVAIVIAAPERAAQLRDIAAGRLGGGQSTNGGGGPGVR
jgi:hypothetical protein